MTITFLMAFSSLSLTNSHLTDEGTRFPKPIMFASTYAVCLTGLHWGYRRWPSCVWQEKTELLIRADQLELYSSLVTGLWVSQTRCNCSISSKLGIPNDQILTKISLLISGQESTWELGSSERELTCPSKGRLPVAMHKASIQGCLTRLFASDLGLVCTHTVYLGQYSKKKRSLKTARGFLGFFALPFTVTCKYTLLTQSQVKQRSQICVWF